MTFINRFRKHSHLVHHPNEVGALGCVVLSPLHDGKLPPQVAEAELFTKEANEHANINIVKLQTLRCCRSAHQCGLDAMILDAKPLPQQIRAHLLGPDRGVRKRDACLNMGREFRVRDSRPSLQRKLSLVAPDSLNIHGEATCNFVKLVAFGVESTDCALAFLGRVPRNLGPLQLDVGRIAGWSAGWRCWRIW